MLMKCFMVTCFRSWGMWLKISFGSMSPLSRSRLGTMRKWNNIQDNNNGIPICSSDIFQLRLIYRYITIIYLNLACIDYSFYQKYANNRRHFHVDIKTRIDHTYIYLQIKPRFSSKNIFNGISVWSLIIACQCLTIFFTSVVL